MFNSSIYTVGHKNVPLYFCPYLYQLLTHFKNSFTGTLCRQFAITWLLYIPLHPKCVSTLPCEISMKYITIITNKHLRKIEKNTSDQHCSEWMVCMTLNCVGLTQSCVIRIIIAMLVWSVFSFTLIFVIIVSFCLHLYFSRYCRNAFSVWWDI